MTSPSDLMPDQEATGGFAYQTSPYPTELAKIISELKYRPGWHFALESFERDPGSGGLTFKVLSRGYDTYHVERGENYAVWHYFPVPPATYNRQSWMEWVRDRLLEVELHEACEFMVVDGKRPFAPNHGPGWNPYVVRSLNTVEAAETTFRGERREGSQA